jgi:hypothetical protein
MARQLDPLLVGTQTALVLATRASSFHDRCEPAGPIGPLIQQRSWGSVDQGGQYTDHRVTGVEDPEVPAAEGAQPVRDTAFSEVVVSRNVDLIYCDKNSLGWRAPA